MWVERVQFKQPLVQNAATFLVGPWVAAHTIPTKIHILKHGQNLSERGHDTPKVYKVIVTQSSTLEQKGGYLISNVTGSHLRSGRSRMMDHSPTDSSGTACFTAHGAQPTISTITFTSTFKPTANSFLFQDFLVLVGNKTHLHVAQPLVDQGTNTLPACGTMGKMIMIMIMRP